jgi:hypothetical protein
MIIEVPDEMYEKLIELATEMTTQDPRGTRMPHMYQIQEKKKVYDWGLNGDVRIWVNGDGYEIETFEEFSEYLNDNVTKVPENIKDLWEDHWELESWIEKNTDLKPCSYSYEPVYHNHFLTAKGCKEHIQRNGYHYNDPVDYLNHAWRNPEMELVSEFLCSLVGKKMHT